MEILSKANIHQAMVATDPIVRPEDTGEFLMTADNVVQHWRRAIRHQFCVDAVVAAVNTEAAATNCHWNAASPLHSSQPEKRSGYCLAGN
jgi:hypothetical protein